MTIQSLRGFGTLCYLCQKWRCAACACHAIRACAGMVIFPTHMDARIMIALAEWRFKWIPEWVLLQDGKMKRKRERLLWDSKKYDASLWLRFSLKPKLLTWNLIHSTLALAFKSSQTVKECKCEMNWNHFATIQLEAAKKKKDDQEEYAGLDGKKIEANLCVNETGEEIVVPHLLILGQGQQDQGRILCQVGSCLGPNTWKDRLGFILTQPVRDWKLLPSHGTQSSVSLKQVPKMEQW